MEQNKQHVFLSLCVAGLLLLSGCETKEPITCILPETSGSSNSPVLVNGTIQLTTPNYGNASYQWTGPNGFASNEQNPEIPNATAAMSGEYHLKVLKGICETPQITTTVSVVPSPVTCNQPNNTATFETFNTYTFNSVYTSTNTGNFELRAGGSGSNITIQFAGTDTPVTAVYTVCHSCSSSELGQYEVTIDAVALGGNYFVAQSGQVVVSFVSGNISAIFCDVPFGGAGTSINPVVSAKITD